MARHPYASLPSYTRWSRSVTALSAANVDPVVSFPFTISPQDRVATAGSCFAQHIARHLRDSGFNYYVVEDGHPLGSQELKEKYNYGVFSARYANIYTSRQLLQLIRRAYGEFTPESSVWAGLDGKSFLDPFRPTIQPGGFSTVEELELDRSQHLRRVREMLESLDYFVFTLGLTEAWFDRVDGSVYPLCPGVSGGVYDEGRVGFVNLRAQDVIDDMSSFFERLFDVNPKAKVILTVSPVPLAATALDRHVLTSTTYSKSALRVAAEELCTRFDAVAYFPSYEIITGQYTRGSYFASDLRSVTEDGVEHVMRLFFKHATDQSTSNVRPIQMADSSASHLAEMARVVQALCEEELIEQSLQNSASPSS